MYAGGGGGGSRRPIQLTYLEVGKTVRQELHVALRSLAIVLCLDHLLHHVAPLRPLLLLRLLELGPRAVRRLHGFLVVLHHGNSAGWCGCCKPKSILGK